MTESECGAFFAQSERILLGIDQWLGEGATVRKTFERVNRFLAAPYSPAAFETVKLLPVDLFSGESIRDRLRELDADVRQWQELAKLGRTLAEWENANAGSLGDYGAAGAPTVASMLGYACHDLNEALSELEELYRRGGYANHGFRLSPEWKTAFIAWKGAEWLEKALINASIVDGLFRDPQRFRLAEWDRETLQKALHREWIRARAESTTEAEPEQKSDPSRRTPSDVRPKSIEQRLRTRKLADAMFSGGLMATGGETDGPHYLALVGFLRQFVGTPHEESIFGVYFQWSRPTEEGVALVEEAAAAEGMTCPEYIARETLNELQRYVRANAIQIPEPEGSPNVGLVPIEDGPAGDGSVRRTGRLPKAESEGLRALLLATVWQHPGMMDDPEGLSRLVGVSVKTARRWCNDLRESFRNQRNSNTDED